MKVTLTKEQEKLVVENLRLTHYIANRYESEIFSKEDLAGFGTIGLIRASKQFDESKGFKFSTLAVKCIRNEIYRVLQKPRILASSLNQKVEDDSDSDFIEFVADEYKEPTKYMDLQNALKILNERDSFIIRRNFGFNEWYMTHKEIAAYLGITTTRVGQLKELALTKLKRYMERKGMEL